ncbi:aflatoxin biosynthesis protein [Coccidioides immitis RMSCC 3703]|uniref:Aflatoxin biosynthesis protein n=1 Tax=Coccidioides immitis RMSCC 3703 TaxID=454286 RepID=A0A0J8TZ58_COCIT|nr:aflatoxin biosynthesis protein [Coccidioides immitis RMSCC 3703]
MPHSPNHIPVNSSPKILTFGPDRGANKNNYPLPNVDRLGEVRLLAGLQQERGSGGQGLSRSKERRLLVEICAATNLITGHDALAGDSHSSSSDDAPLNVRDARQRVLNSAAKIQQLISEPTEFLVNLSVEVLSSLNTFWSTIQVELKEAHIVPINCKYSMALSLPGARGDSSASVARMAMTRNFLCEPVPGHVAHNAVSRLFVTNPAYLGWTRFMTEFYMPVASKFSEATEKWGDTVAGNQTAVNLAMNTQLTAFDFITQSREWGRLFSAYMKGVQASRATNVKHVVADYDWEAMGKALVVHIDGAPGNVCIALAESYPALSFIIQDTPETVGNCRGLLRSQPENVRKRITTAAHRALEPQTVTNADVYLLRMVLHNHTDDEASRILANLVPALKQNPSARILIVDTLLPEPGSIGIVDEGLARYRDMTMMEVFNTKERDRQEFEDILNKASDGEGKLVTIIETLAFDSEE